MSGPSLPGTVRPLGASTIATLACALLAGLLPLAKPVPAATPDPWGEAHVVLLHTNDLHGTLAPWQGWEGELAGRRLGGAAWIAGVVDSVRREEGRDKVLLLDAGDAVGDSMLADLTGGAAVLRTMQAIGYDVVGLGNHEPDFTIPTWLRHVADTGMAAVAANVRRRSDGALVAPPYVVVERGGVRVGVLGLAYPNTPLTTSRSNVADYVFEQDPAASVRNVLSRMRADGADLVIVLSHLGLGADRKLAGDVPEIDVIVGGHSHNRMERALSVGRTLIVQAGAHGSDVGRLDLWLAAGKPVRHRRTLITVDHQRVQPDAAVARLLDEIRAPFRERLAEIVGTAGAPLVRAQTLAGQEPRKRDEASPVDALFADALRDATGSDVALLPGVGYGVAIPAGPITAEQLRNFVPHDAKVVTMTLSGRQIRQIVERSIENVHTENTREKVGGMIQVSGLRFRYDPRRPAGQRVVSIEHAGRPLAPARQYRVATNSLLAEGGHRYVTFLDGRDRRERGKQFEVIREYLHARSPVLAPAPGGRIVKVADAG